MVEQLIRNQQANGSNPLAGSKDLKGISVSFSRIPLFLTTKTSLPHPDFTSDYLNSEIRVFCVEKQMTNNYWF